MTANGYQHMVLDYYVEKMRRLKERRLSELRAISTREGAVAYRRKIRQAVSGCFGPWPEKVPLDLRYGECLRQDGFSIRKLSFASRKDFRVTAALYLPDHLDKPAPAVLATCGHAEEGKACDTYQEFSRRLALNGFVVLNYDPIEQGERGQYADETVTGGLPMPTLCGLHNIMGKQLELIGEYFGAWRVWDGRCALDVLLSLPEVDPAHVGVTGNSGGGTLTEWLWANDDRLTMAAPSCHITSWLVNLENELPCDAEQYPPGLIGQGLEMIDLMIARAPAPAILLGQKYDFFERRGLLEAYAELKHFYHFFDAEDQAALFIGPEGHGYSVHNQEAMVDFFCRQCGRTARKVSPGFLPIQCLNATPAGNVVRDGSVPIFKLIQEKADALAAGRPVLNAGELADRLKQLLNLPERRGIPHFRIPRSTFDPAHEDLGVWARYAVETDDFGIRAILRKWITDGHPETLDVEKDLLLYLPDIISEEDCTADPRIQKIIRNSPAFYALDPRGLGESRPEEQTGYDFLSDYGGDYLMHGYGLMFGECYMGRRIHDILRVLDLLYAQGAENIRLCGRGQGAVLAAFTAVLDSRTAGADLLDCPASFREWLDEPFDRWPAASHLKGILKYFDFPDVLRVLGPRARVLSSWNACRCAVQ